MLKESDHIAVEGCQGASGAEHSSASVAPIEPSVVADPEEAGPASVLKMAYAVMEPLVRARVVFLVIVVHEQVLGEVEDLV